MEVTGVARKNAGKPIQIGEKASFSKTITEADVLLFAAVSADFNPVHIDAEYAKSTRFKGRIAHGMLSAGLISAVLGTKLPGPGCIYLGQQLKFLAPVFIGDTVTAVVEVMQVREDKPILTMKTECFNQHGDKIIEGQAVVLTENPAS